MQSYIVIIVVAVLLEQVSERRELKFVSDVLVVYLLSFSLILNEQRLIIPSLGISVSTIALDIMSFTPSTMPLGNDL